MNSTSLTTDYLKIGQSGPTVDGRVIDPVWLRDAAETYAPAVYTAMLWPEHERWGNNYGLVLELAAKEEGGVTALYARLSPNASYIWETQYGQKLFFSMELTENFAGSGKSYLTGLGVTDSPASLGLPAHKFHSRKAGPATNFYAGAPCPAGAKAPGWFEAFCRRFTPTGTYSQEDAMTEEQLAAFTAMQQAIADLTTGLAALEQTVADIKAAVDALKAKDEASGDDGASGETPDYAALCGQVSKLSGLVAAMNTRFSRAMPVSPIPESTAPANAAGLLY